MEWLTNPECAFCHAPVQRGDGIKLIDRMVRPKRNYFFCHILCCEAWIVVRVQNERKAVLGYAGGNNG